MEGALIKNGYETDAFAWHVEPALYCRLNLDLENWATGTSLRWL